MGPAGAHHEVAGASAEQPVTEWIGAQLLEIETRRVEDHLGIADFLNDAHLTGRERHLHLQVVEEDHDGPQTKEDGREEDVAALVDAHVEQPQTAGDALPYAGKVENDRQENDETDDRD